MYFELKNKGVTKSKQRAGKIYPPWTILRMLMLNGNNLYYFEPKEQGGNS